MPGKAVSPDLTLSNLGKGEKDIPCCSGGVKFTNPVTPTAFPDVPLPGRRRKHSTLRGLSTAKTYVSRFSISTSLQPERSHERGSR